MLESNLHTNIDGRIIHDSPKCRDKLNMYTLMNKQDMIYGYMENKQIYNHKGKQIIHLSQNLKLFETMTLERVQILSQSEFQVWESEALLISSTSGKVQPVLTQAAIRKHLGYIMLSEKASYTGPHMI